MTIVRSLTLSLLAALTEIGGAWLVWQGVRKHRGLLWAGAGVVALGVHGFVATLQPDAAFGRVLAAYGGVFVAGSLTWGVLVDGFRPDRYDILGALRLPRRRRSDHVRASGLTPLPIAGGLFTDDSLRSPR